MLRVTTGAALVLVSTVGPGAGGTRAVEIVAQPVVVLVGVSLRRRLAATPACRPLQAALAGIEGSLGLLIWCASLGWSDILCLSGTQEPGGGQQLRDAHGLDSVHDSR